MFLTQSFADAHMLRYIGIDTNLVGYLLHRNVSLEKMSNFHKYTMLTENPKVWMAIVSNGWDRTILRDQLIDTYWNTICTFRRYWKSLCNLAICLYGVPPKLVRDRISAIINGKTNPRIYFSTKTVKFLITHGCVSSEKIDDWRWLSEELRKKYVNILIKRVAQRYYRPPAMCEFP